EVGDESVVEEEGGRSAGFSLEHHDHAVVRGQTKVWIAGKSGNDLDRVVTTAVQVPGFNVDLAAFLRAIAFRNFQLNDRRQFRLARGIRGKSLFYGRDAGARIEQGANLRLAQNQDFTAHPQSLSFSFLNHFASESIRFGCGRSGRRLCAFALAFNDQIQHRDDVLPQNASRARGPCDSLSPDYR